MTNPFTSYAFPVTGGTANRTLPARLLETVSVKDFGALGDGSGALLSSRYATLADAQLDYPGVASLSDTIDWAAIMAALSWNSIFATVASRTYTGLVRFTSLVWSPASGGIVTATTGDDHGLTAGDQILHWATFATPGNYGGAFTVSTVLDSKRFTYPLASDPGLPAADMGYFTAIATSVIWLGGVVTVDFSAPHRLPVGLVANAYGFSSDQDHNGITVLDGNHTITSTPTARRLTFSFAGSGVVTPAFFAQVRNGTNNIEVVSWPGLPAWYPTAIFAYFLAEVYPTCLAGSYATKATDIAGTTLTFTDLWNDVYPGDGIRLYVGTIGKIYFPPGTYHISKPLQLPTIGVIGTIEGCPGQSIIRGSFPDYLLNLNQKAAGGGPVDFKGLTFINDDANGSCMRMVINQGYVSHCKFTSGAVGLNTGGTNSRDSVSYGVQVMGCLFFASSGAADAVGIAATANNGTYYGNYFKGLKHGIRCHEFNQNVDGSQFVDCDVGMYMGANPEGLPGGFCVTYSLRGNSFNNCGVGIYCYNTSVNRIEGIYILGGPNSTRGFYGFNIGQSMVKGLHATGQFSTNAIFASHSGNHQTAELIYSSVCAENSGAGTVWELPTIQCRATLQNCNISSVLAYDGSVGRAITNLSYNSGTGVVTLTTDSAHNFDGQYISVAGVKVGGSTNNSYNGVYTWLSQTGSTVTYHVNVAPGSADANTGGIVSAGGPYGNASIANMQLKDLSWSSGIVTAETFYPHGIVNFGTASVVGIVGGNSANGYTGTFVVTVTDPTHFTYAVASNPGTVDSSSKMTSLPSSINGTSIVASFPTMIGLQRNSMEGYTRASISDGQKLAGGTANIGDLVKGGGSQHISVAWTRNGWMRRG